jgi:hypothetical protein
VPFYFIVGSGLINSPTTTISKFIRVTKMPISKARKKMNLYHKYCSNEFLTSDKFNILIQHRFVFKGNKVLNRPQNGLADFTVKTSNGNQYLINLVYSNGERGKAKWLIANITGKEFAADGEYIAFDKKAISKSRFQESVPGFILLIIFISMSNVNVTPNYAKDVVEIVNVVNSDLEANKDIDIKIYHDGEAGKFEKAYKEYARDMVNSTNRIVKTLTDMNYYNVLSPEFLKKDKPKKLANSIKVLKDGKEAVDLYIKEYEKMSSNDYIKKKFENYDVSIKVEETYFECQKALNTDLGTLSEMCESAERLGNYLLENIKEWEVDENNTLIFNSQEEVDEYNRLWEILQKDTEKLAKLFDDLPNTNSTTETII